MCTLAPIRAEKRVALVIGNDRYSNLTANEQTQKAVNDVSRIVLDGLRPPDARLPVEIRPMPKGILPP